MKIDATTHQKLPEHLKALFQQAPNPSRDEVIALFPNSNGAGPSLPRVKVTGYGAGIGSGESAYTGGERIPFSAGSGSAARFFYCAKASRKDRNEGLDDPGPQFQHSAEYLLKEDAPDWVRAEVERLLNQSC